MGTQQRPYADFYQERNAELVRQVDIPGVNSQTITRLWRCDLPEDQVQGVIAEMDLYTSAKNANQLRYVTNPSIGKTGDTDPKSQAPGVWRLQWNAYNPRYEAPIGIYQQLSQGYLQPPTGTVTWAQLDLFARITKVVDWSSSAKVAIKPYFVVTYPNVAQETVKAFVDALVPRGTITNPKFDLQAQLTGSYKFVGAKNIEQDDGSSIVLAILMDSTDPVGLEVLYANNCGSKITHTLYMGIAAPIAVPAGSSGVEYNVSDFRFDVDMGMYSMVIVKTEQKTLTTGIYEQGETDIERNDAQTFLGVRAGNLDDQGAAVPLWTPGNPTPGLEYTQDITKNQNCTTDVRQKKLTVKNLVSATVRKIKDLFHTQVATGNKADATALADPATPSGGVVQTVENVKNGLGQYDTTLTVTTELPVSAAEKANAATVFETSTTQTDKAQDPATSLTASVTAGTIIDKQGSKTAGALMDVTTRTKVELPVTGAVKDNEATIFQTRAVQTDRAQAAGTALTASASGGVIVSKKGDVTPGNLLDVRTDTITEIPVSDAVVSDHKDQFKYELMDEDRAQPLATDTTAPVAAGGVIVQKDATLTPGGLKNIRTNTTTEKPVSNARISGTKTLFDVKAAAVDRHQAPSTSLTVPAASGGVITTKIGDKTPGVLLDVTTETLTEQPVSAAVTSDTNTIFQRQQSNLDKNQTAPNETVPTATGGVIVQKQIHRTPGDLKDLETGTTTELPVSSARSTSGKTIFDFDTVVVDKNQTSPDASVPAATGGLIVTKTVDKTPGDLKDLTTQQRQEQLVVAAAQTNIVTALETVTEVLDKGRPAGTALPASVTASTGVVVSSAGTKTPGNLLDVKTTTEAAVEVDKSWTYNDRDGVATLNVFRNLEDSAVTSKATALSANNKNSLQVEPTKYGRFSGQTWNMVNSGEGVAFFFADTSDRVIKHPTEEYYDSRQPADKKRYYYIDTIYFVCRRGSGIQAGLAAWEGGAERSPSTFDKDLQHNTYYCQRVTSILRQKWTIPDAGGTPEESGDPSLLFDAENQPWGNS